MLSLTAPRAACCLSIVCCLAATVVAETPPPLRFNAQGKFRIVQFTDTHWNAEAEKCRKTLDVIQRVLDAEKPDLAVLTGDIVTLDRAPLEGWKSVTEPMISRKIPWAAVLGNHDDENHGVSRQDIVKYLAALPFSLVEQGPESLAATGNYIVGVAAGTSTKPAAVLYFLDSGAYPRNKTIQKACKDLPAKYAWISFDQIQWYRQSSRAARAANRGQSPPALAFFHIPLAEYAHPFLRTVIGTRKEDVCCGALNSGMFAALIEEGDIMGVFTGHDHDNDWAAMLFDICLAYGRCSGFGGYGELPRGARIIELSEGKREFESWIRSGDGSVANRLRYPAAFEKQ